MIELSPRLIFREESDGAAHFWIWRPDKKVTKIYHHHGSVGANYFLGQLHWDHGMSTPAAESENFHLPLPKMSFVSSISLLGRCCDAITTPTRYETLLGHGSGCILPFAPLRSRLHPQQSSFGAHLFFGWGPSHVGVTVWVPKWQNFCKLLKDNLVPHLYNSLAHQVQFLGHWFSQCLGQPLECVCSWVKRGGATWS